MSEFIVSIPGFNIREHEIEVEKAIQAAVLAALAGLPQSDPIHPAWQDFSKGAFFLPPRGWRGLIRLPAEAVGELAEIANSKLTVTQSPFDERGE